MTDISDNYSALDGRLVVGTDGTSQADVAVDWAARHAADVGLGLAILSVAPPLSSAAPEVAAYVYADAPIESAREVVRIAVERVRRHQPGLDVVEVAVVGAIVEALAEATRHAHAVVVGSRGLRGLRGAIAGSVSNALVGRSGGPVIVAHASGASVPNGPVVLGIDGGEGTGKAVRFAFDEARRLKTTVVALTAWSHLTDDLRPVPPDEEGGTQQRMAMLEEALAGPRRDYPDVEVELRVVREDPLDALVEASGTASMVVTSPRTRGLIASLVEGSTSRDLLQRATCPAAVVRAG